MKDTRINSITTTIPNATPNAMINPSTNTILHFKGLLRDLHYNACVIEPLNKFPLREFDINRAKASGIIETEKTEVAYAKWVSPKRTQISSLARTYSSYSASKTVSKTLAIVPVLKDDGRDGDLDKLHYSTVSSLNLLNTYVVLGYHNHADKNSTPGSIDRDKLTNHRFERESIRSQIQAIIDYPKNAFHWNKQLLETQFGETLRQALDAYWKISDRTGVKIHPYIGMDHYQQSVIADLETFEKNSLTKSQDDPERSPNSGVLKYPVSGSKATFTIETDRGGCYPLVPESLFWLTDRYVIQESRNSAKKPFLDLSEIQEALFRLIPYVSLHSLQLNGEAVRFSVRLKLTGFTVLSQVLLPADSDTIEAFFTTNSGILKESDQRVIYLLNQEAEQNDRLEISIGGNG